MGIEFNNEQIYAIYDMESWYHSASSGQVFEISGPAGSGKTTLIRYLIERLNLKYDEVLFLAYMGKAASQMARNGLPAKTIHSAIYDYVKVYDRDEKGKILFTEDRKPKMKKTFVKKDRIDKKIKLIVVDEGSTVDERIGEDLLSFGIPVIVLGDLNQLPPVFGNPYFLKSPDVILHQIMRQAEGDPIIWLSQQVLSGKDLKIGIYDKSAVIKREDINQNYFRKSDIILTCTNRLRYNVNNFCREEIKQIQKLEYPHIGEKVVCRKNNWGKCIDNLYYLTNGTTGFVDYISKESFNGKTMEMDFRLDFLKKSFKHIKFDYNHLYSIPGEEENQDYASMFYDKIEFGYALTVHSSQGSQWGNVCFLFEEMMRDKEDRKKLLYTGITRASESVIIAI